MLGKPALNPRELAGGGGGERKDDQKIQALVRLVKVVFTQASGRSLRGGGGEAGREPGTHPPPGREAQFSYAGLRLSFMSEGLRTTASMSSSLTNEPCDALATPCYGRGRTHVVSQPF